MLSKCWFTKGASTNIHNLSAGCNSGEYGGRNSQNISVGTWTFALRCHPAISWTNRIIFLLLLPRMRLRFLILHLSIVYLSSVLNSNEFFPSLVLQNPTHITLNIWVILLLSVFLLLVITPFLKLVLIRFYVCQKPRLLFGPGDIFLSAI